MSSTVIAAALAPLLVAASGLAARRWGPRAAGVVSAFPAIVGPVLLALALEHGPAFAARAAAGTMIGLVSLAAFALVYGRVASRWGWRASLIAGWAAAAACGIAAGGTAAGGAGGRSGARADLAVAVVSLGVSYVALRSPRYPTRQSGLTAAGRGGLATRMLAAAALVVALSLLAGRLGPVVGGVLAALPVLASVVTVFTHRELGGPATVSLLRGMIAGMGGFVVFCEIVAALSGHAAIAPTFLIATAGALVVQALIAWAPPMALASACERIFGSLFRREGGAGAAPLADGARGVARPAATPGARSAAPPAGALSEHS